MPKRRDSPVLVAFARRVRESRQKQGLSQEELAFRAGVHRTYIGFVERAERSITLESIQRIAKALGVSMSTLFKGIQ